MIRGELKNKSDAEEKVNYADGQIDNTTLNFKLVLLGKHREFKTTISHPCYCSRPA